MSIYNEAACMMFNKRYQVKNGGNCSPASCRDDAVKMGRSDDYDECYKFVVELRDVMPPDLVYMFQKCSEFYGGKI